MPFIPITPVIGISIPNDTFLAHGPCRPGSPYVFAFYPFQPCFVQHPSPHTSRSRAIGYGPLWTQVSDAVKKVVPVQRFVDSGHPSPPRASDCAHRLDVRPRAGFTAGPEPCCSGPGRSAVQLPALRTSESSGSAVAGPPGGCSPLMLEQE
jgi:hypothetical protein